MKYALFFPWRLAFLPLYIKQKILSETADRLKIKMYLFDTFVNVKLARKTTRVAQIVKAIAMSFEKTQMHRQAWQIQVNIHSPEWTEQKESNKTSKIQIMNNTKSKSKKARYIVY